MFCSVVIPTIGRTSSSRAVQSEWTRNSRMEKSRLLSSMIPATHKSLKNGNMLIACERSAHISERDVWHATQVQP